ncbi:MAG: class I SAM-dependent methyltransferase [Gammaproteobacteria bacterium]|jgi:predicted methyltransferase|nr:class I SAM-dependent methyltransferase [Gammaproteobacteria bacterium]MBT5203390.1 class I SAM-dependent methyltransferase [Gammaproteobacteria bacterium]MBT5604227.1 class I SAM-dependent methyltransferase [Gammaproteobacteria bacterium]MBT6247023.1 class I SAM-dependent methyltransferase [Gammaproteobacteria bacterium]
MRTKATLYCFFLGLMLSFSVSAEPVGDLQKALKNDARATADKARDAGRKPAQVLAFLGVSKGMTGIDIWAAGGYYTEVLSLAVGATGKVYAQNPKRILEFRDGANGKALSKRLANDRLANVSRINNAFPDLGLEPGSIDFALTALNFHDISSSEAAATAFAKAVLVLLKPGGVLGVIDHEGSADNDNSKLHRGQSRQVFAILEAAGFEIAATSEMLRNSADTLDQSVFSAGLRGQTSRFIIKAVKPSN